MSPIDILEAECASAEQDTQRLPILNRLAFALARAGEMESAQTRAREAESLAFSLGNELERGRAQCTHGLCHYLRADYFSGLACCLEACSIAEQEADQEGLAAALLAAAACHYQMGTFEEAHTALLQTLAILDEMPDDHLAFRAHNTLGAILTNKRKFAEAEANLKEAIGIARRTADEFNLRRAEVNLADVHHRRGQALREQGDEEGASRYFEQAIATCERVRAQPGMSGGSRDAAGSAGTLGELYMAVGRLDEAWALFEEMLQYGSRLKNPHLQAEALLHMGKLHTMRGAMLQARDCLDESVKLASGAKVQHLVAQAQEGLAHWYEARGEFKEALAQYRHYMGLHEQLLRRELESTAKARALWVEFQQARRDAEAYRQRAEHLSARNEALAEQASRHRRDALHDPLTGLANRRYLDEKLAGLAASLSPGMQLSLAIIDIDDFKGINDSFTHTLGDAVLRQLAAELRATSRESDLAARHGGDEFVIVLPGTGGEGAHQVMDRLRQRVGQHDWTALAKGLKVTLSVGVAEIAAGESVSTLMHRADEALYAAKHRGRNQVVLA